MPKTDEKLDPKYLDFIYRNTGGKMGKPLPKEQAPQPQTPPPEIKKYDFPENRLAKFLYAFGGGNPAAIDQMALSRQQHQSMYDPMSERSRVARDLASKIGAPATPDLSAGDIESYLPSYEKLLAMQSKGSGGPKEKKYSESQSKYALHAGSIENALYNLDKLKKKGYDPSTWWQSFQGLESYPEFFKEEDRKLFEQAATDLGMGATFIKSGQAAPKYEAMTIGATYADRPGDTPAVKEQKRIDRELFLNQASEASGGMAGDIINKNRVLRSQLEQQSPENISQGKGDVTKEVWQLPNGEERHIDPNSAKYKMFAEEAQKVGAKRVR